MKAYPRQDVQDAYVVVSGVEVYDVAKTPTGWQCDCGDWVWRREYSREGCKHIKKVLEIAAKVG